MNAKIHRDWGSGRLFSLLEGVRRRLPGAGVSALAVATACALGLPNSSVLAQTSCGAPPACTGVFCSGFEEGSLSLWDDYDGNPPSTNVLMADPGPCNRPGNTVVKLQVPSGRGGADLVKVLPGPGYDKLYVRWYQKWETGFNFSIQSHNGVGLHAGDRNLLGQSDIRPNGADFFATKLEPDYGHGANQDGRGKLYTYYRGMNQQCSDPTSNCWGDSFPTPSQRATIQPPQYQTNRWYCLELMLDAGTPVATQAQADGVQTFWVDGVQYGPWTNLWHRTTANLKINILSPSLFFHSDHPAAGVMLDDIVVSTSRVGCHGATSGLPGAPRNLRILPGN